MQILKKETVWEVLFVFSKRKTVVVN